MAGAEIAASSRDVMGIQEEEGDSIHNNRAQVIQHLQPSMHGINHDIADTCTTVLAIETHHDASRSETEEIEYGYPITCGESRAILLFKKFVCPGINVKCVKFNGQIISPKQFVHLAGKATLKDWKRAIRLGGVMIRKMMDSGQIDFYQHDTVCSNTCRSTKFDLLINGTRLLSGTAAQPGPSCLAADPLEGQLLPLTGEFVHEAEEPVENKFSAMAECSSNHPTRANGHPVKTKTANTPDGMLSLWRGVADSGLMGTVLSGIQTELLTTLKGVEVRTEKACLQESDAVILNSLCEMFGLLDSVKEALEQRRSRNEDNKIHCMHYDLDAFMEEQKKLGCHKSTPCKSISLKHLKLHQLHGPFKHSSASVATSQRYHDRAVAVRTHRDGRGAMWKKKLVEAGNKEAMRVEKEDISGSHKKPELKTVEFVDPCLGLYDSDKESAGRKSPMKPKAKRDIGTPYARECAH